MITDRPRYVITRDRFDAVLFDLDGVLTDTARLHAWCWKQTFDDYLRERASLEGRAFRPFDIATDYRDYVDGKPRYDGARDFLRSRGLDLPEGAPDDAPGDESVCGLANRKNVLLNDAIAAGGVEANEGAVALLQRLAAMGIMRAVVTSSRNCPAILRAAGLAECVEAVVDGNTIAREHLAGKPQPDAFLRAAALLGVRPERAVVVEDAVAGVQAGVTGGFGLVVGVAGKGNADLLRINGAHLVVGSIDELDELVRTD